MCGYTRLIRLNSAQYGAGLWCIAYCYRLMVG